MDLLRLRLGELVAAVAAAGLLVVLFENWNRDAGPAGTELHSGWSALGWVVVVLVLVAVATAFALAFVTVTRQPAAFPIGAAVLTTAVGIAVLVVLAIRVLLLDDSTTGAYVGLLLCLGIPVGGWLAMADERKDAPYSAAPDLPRRPPPPVEA